MKAVRPLGHACAAATARILNARGCYADEHLVFAAMRRLGWITADRQPTTAGSGYITVSTGYYVAIGERRPYTRIFVSRCGIDRLDEALAHRSPELNLGIINQPFGF